MLVYLLYWYKSTNTDMLVYLLYWYKSTSTDAAASGARCWPTRGRAASAPGMYYMIYIYIYIYIYVYPYIYAHCIAPGTTLYAHFCSRHYSTCMRSIPICALYPGTTLHIRALYPGSNLPIRALYRHYSTYMRTLYYYLCVLI